MEKEKVNIEENANHLAVNYSEAIEPGKDYTNAGLDTENFYLTEWNNINNPEADISFENELRPLKDREAETGVQVMAVTEQPILLQKGKPGGLWNRRPILVGAAIVVALVIFGWGKNNSSADPSQLQKSTKPKVAEEVVRVSAPNQMALASPDDRPQIVPTRSAEPPLPPPVEKEPEPVVVPPPPPPPQEEVQEEETFATPLRAAGGQKNEGSKSGRGTSNEDDDEEQATRSNTTRRTGNPEGNATGRFLRGTKIKMTMSEPFRSGIETSVTARVTSDVKDKDGNLLLPRGSTASITFVASEINGRVLNRRGEPVTFTTPEGESVNILGVIKDDKDGFAGLTGKVKKIHTSSGLGRVFGTMGRIATRAAGTAADAMGYGAGDEIYRAADSISGVERSRIVVEIPQGISFTFTVDGGKN